MNGPEFPQNRQEQLDLIERTRRIRKDLRGASWTALASWAVSYVLQIAVISVYCVAGILPQIMESLPQDSEGRLSGVEVAAGEYAEKIREAVVEKLTAPEFANVLVIFTVVFGLLAAVPFLIYGRRRSLTVKPTLNGLKAKDVARLFVAVTGLNMLASLGVMLTEAVFNANGFSIYIDMSMSDTPFSYWMMAVYAVLAAPVIEEFVYRGMLLDGLRKHGDRFAVVISAVIFALAHGNLMQFLPAVVCGLTLGYIRVKTGSWGVCVILHALNNLFSQVLNALTDRMLAGAASDAARSACGLLNAAIMIGLGIAGAVLLVRFVREKGELAVQKPLQIRYTAMLSIPALIYLYVSFRMIIGNILFIQ